MIQASHAVVNGNQVVYAMGDSSTIAPLAATEMPIPKAGKLKLFAVNRWLNTLTAASKVTVLKNGVATLLFLSFNPAEVAVKTDSVTEVVVAAGDKVTFELEALGTPSSSLLARDLIALGYFPDP